MSLRSTIGAGDEEIAGMTGGPIARQLNASRAPPEWTTTVTTSSECNLVKATIRDQWVRTGQDVRMEPHDHASIRAVAARFGAGEGSTLEMCSSLRGRLHDLGAEEPLAGDFFRLFRVLESWETATGTDQQSAAETARTIARHLGRGA
jgi:hypothetical protein